jgi:hypothetical protein
MKHEFRPTDMATPSWIANSHGQIKVPCIRNYAVQTRAAKEKKWPAFATAGSGRPSATVLAG